MNDSVSRLEAQRDLCNQTEERAMTRQEMAGAAKRDRGASWRRPGRLVTV